MFYLLTYLLLTLIFKLKIGTKIISAIGNVHTNALVFLWRFCFWVKSPHRTDRRTDGQTDVRQKL